MQNTARWCFLHQLLVPGFNLFGTPGQQKMMAIIFLFPGTRYQRILQLDDILHTLFPLTKYIRKKK